MTRRDLLGLAGIAPGALSLISCGSEGPPRLTPLRSSREPPEKHFNLIVHGMAAYEMTDPMVIHFARVPQQDQYVRIRKNAGNSGSADGRRSATTTPDSAAAAQVAPPASQPAPPAADEQTYELHRERKYRLDLGLQGPLPNNPIPRLSPTEHILLERTNGDDLQINPAGEYCSIQLPVPDVLRCFRWIEKSASEDLFAPGKTRDTYRINPHLFPTVYVFRYLVFGENPRLLVDTGDTAWPMGGAAGNLVIHAEPGDCQSSSWVHFIDSLFREPLDLNYTQPHDAFPPDNSGAAIGVDADDLRSLYEGSSCRGGYAINYLPLVIYPQNSGYR